MIRLSRKKDPAQDTAAPPSRRSVWRKRWMALVFLIMFSIGYNTTTSVVQSCKAASLAVTAATCAVNFNQCWDCISAGWTALTTEFLSQAQKQIEKIKSNVLEIFTNTNLLRMVGSMLQGFNGLEQNIIGWVDAFWNKALLPSMQAETNQLNAAAADKSRMLGAGTDATNMVETRLKLDDRELQTERHYRPAENVCVAASGVGGFGRSAALQRAARDALEREGLAPGLNKVGTPGAQAAVEAERVRQEDFENYYCDPASNGGMADCSGMGLFANADTQPTKYILNTLTIDTASSPLMAKTVQTIVNNMVGVPSMDPIPTGAIDGARGQEQFLDRRSYLARYAAARSVPHLSVSWRLPGSQMGDWVKVLREKAGMPTTGISQNPSYREVMHAMVIDRFNSGRFAVGMITDKSAVDLEKLTLSVFQLMMLRDYYELLERKALALAVEVSVLSDQEVLPDAVSVVPVSQ